MDVIAKKTVCIAGKNEIAVFGLDTVIRQHPDVNVVCLVNENDPGYDTWQPSLKRFAESRGIPVLTIDQCYEIKELIFISLEYDKLVKPELFSTTRLYNIHFSKLPSYKGMYTSALPLLFGEDESGVTLHRIDHGIDTGEIIDQLSFSISEIASARELYFSYLQYAKNLFEKNIAALLKGDVISYPQRCEKSSYYSKKAVDYSELNIDLRQTATQIKNQIRAFNFPEYQLPKVLGYPINAAEISDTKSTLKAGSIVSEDTICMVLSTIDYDVVLMKDKYSELIDACRTNNLDLATECVEFDLDLNVRNAKGWTPLIVAACYGSVDVMSLLIDSGADIDLPNYKGTSPLMYAMSYFDKTNDKATYEMLLNYGANSDIADILVRP